jgi:hypothetical protein
MRRVLVLGLVVFGGAVHVALASAPTRIVSTAGVTLRVPTGWHAVVARTPTCDPERLIVASSAPIHTNRTGQLTSPPTGQVLILLLDDRYRQYRPVGDLHRPARFVVAWSRLVHIKPSCGLPNSPAYMRYFKTQARYIGFIVYPAGRINAEVRADTLAIMDSLRVTAR